MVDLWHNGLPTANDEETAIKYVVAVIGWCGDPLECDRHAVAL
jgi:hypothetical protein